jgi:AcrR family transcriptional regulator
MCSEIIMTRAYNMKKRAEQQSETRQRIVEAAVDLHGTVGPARTTFSMLAEHAGVQRHTLYAYFPDERSLFLACSALHFEREPMPNADAWRKIESREERLRIGLRALYDWYERNESIAGCILRDMEVHDVLREVATLRFVPHLMACERVLGAGLGTRQKAMLHLAIGYYTWRSLARASGLKTAVAVDTMVQAIIGAK